MFNSARSHRVCGAALNVASTANRLHFGGFEIISMVVTKRGRATVNAQGVVVAREASLYDFSFNRPPRRILNRQKGAETLEAIARRPLPLEGAKTNHAAGVAFHCSADSSRVGRSAHCCFNTHAASLGGMGLANPFSFHFRQDSRLMPVRLAASDGRPPKSFSKYSFAVFMANIIAWPHEKSKQNGEPSQPR